jgi:glutamyl-tRNA synthetase
MVRTRFAPSPTGYLHIGGVRTALFNWLFARQHGGQFILRIDDTDEGRNVEAALAPILHGFRWLGMDWDEGAELGGPCGPYYQSQKGDRYRAVVRELIDKGAAYYDFTPDDECKAERAAAEKEKRLPNFRGPWMARNEEERARLESQGRTAVVRLFMPRAGNCEFPDHVRGAYSKAWADEQDHVIQRADGSCLYNLASVVDDYDMKVTHVIRAEEHLSNTPRQVFIIDALGWPRPEYAHLPFVAEPGSKRKLSKRELKKYLNNADFKKVYEKGQEIARAIGLQTCDETYNPVIVDFYEQTGYLPDAILNYLLLLGWSLDDKAEHFTRDDMIKLFSLDRVNQAPASFDVKKLNAFQGRWMAQLPLDEKLSMCLPYLVRAKHVADPVSDSDREKVRAIVQAAGDRIVIAGDVLDYADFFTPDDALPYDDKAFDKRVRKPGVAEMLAAVRDELASAEFDAAKLEALVQAFAQTKGVGLGEVVNALRVSLTGKGVGFGLYETLVILGKDRSLARIARALARA